MKVGTFILYSFIVCTMFSCGRYNKTNKLVAEKAISHTQQMFSERLDEGKELFIRASGIDSLYSDNIQYLLLLPDSCTNSLLFTEYDRFNLSPDNTIIICNDEGLIPDSAGFSIITGSRIGLDFLNNEEGIVFFIRRSNEVGYLIKKASIR